jgi:glycosyltransferase involved in cell wall biosynthesis
MLPDRSLTACKHYAEQVQHAIQLHKPDIVFSPGTIPIALLKTSLPVITWTDATFANVLNYYPEFSGFSAKQVSLGHRLEREDLNRTRFAIYSSDWARNSAITEYGQPADRIRTVPFGANYPTAPDIDLTAAIRGRTSTNFLQLVSIGKDWGRKGFDRAISFREALQAAVQRNVILKLVGVDANRTVPAGVEVLGFFDKKKPEGWQQYLEVLSSSHFHVLFSTADCTPIVINESMGLALPTLASATGGIPSMIRNGVNGFLLDPAESVAALVPEVAAVIKDSDKYASLCQSTLHAYRSEFSWEAAAASLRDLIRAV